MTDTQYWRTIRRLITALLALFMTSIGLLLWEAHVEDTSISGTTVTILGCTITLMLVFRSTATKHYRQAQLRQTPQPLQE